MLSNHRNRGLLDNVSSMARVFQSLIQVIGAPSGITLHSRLLPDVYTIPDRPAVRRQSLLYQRFGGFQGFDGIGQQPAGVRGESLIYSGFVPGNFTYQMGGENGFAAVFAPEIIRQQILAAIKRFEDSDRCAGASRHVSSPASPAGCRKRGSPPPPSGTEKKRISRCR